MSSISQLCLFPGHFHCDSSAELSVIVMLNTDVDNVVEKIAKKESKLDAEQWRLKYSILEEQYSMFKRRNEELEEKLLTLVEKVEGDKSALSDEIDQLSAKLTAANMRIASLEKDCEAYKEDCRTAVNLLHCQPSYYVANTSGTDNSNACNEKRTSKASFVHGGTFPPMTYLMPNEEEDQPEDPNTERDLTEADIGISQHIRCPKCSTIIPLNIKRDESSKDLTLMTDELAVEKFVVPSMTGSSSKVEVV
ncbi:hypothetical protein AB6A40_005569 [Gnathostoma spinigerum]|uniref:Uncharacterized protein n=1 Tax=Gnathostoma spinigerum TaxID=75299 RepID=A0ABD6EFT4_9BILA